MLADSASAAGSTYSGARTNPRRGFFSRRIRHDHLEPRARNANICQREVHFSVKNFLPYHDTSKGARAEFPFTRRRSLGHERKKSRRVQGRDEVFLLPVVHRVQVDWHKSTGLCAYHQRRYEVTKKDGLLKKFPARIAGAQLTNKAPTRTRRLRFGNYVQGARCSRRR